MRELECEIWCPKCHAYYAKVYRIKVREGMWEHVKEPASHPIMCTVCEIPVERKR